MLLNNWLVTQSFENNKNQHERVGLCFHLDPGAADVNHIFLQKLPENSFSILISADDGRWEAVNESYIEKIIGILFQPCYYLFDYQPLIFSAGKTQASVNFINRLTEKCAKQGLKTLILDVKEDDGDGSVSHFAYRVASTDIDYNLITKNWIYLYLNDKNPGEIHFLVADTDPNSSEILNQIFVGQSIFKKTEQYKMADVLYKKQKMIEDYRHELDLRAASEKDAQLYLNIQKEQTSNNVRWYYHEYEILPGWYKKLGHVIKVLMGKRSFRSLFDDNVKKHND